MAPQGGIYKSWGGIQSIWGIGEEWTPSGGINKYPLIAQDVLLAGVLWRLHQWLLMLHYDLRAVAHYHRTQYPDQNGHWAYEGQHFWLRGIHTSDKNGNACIFYRHNEFQNFLQNLALDAHDALHQKGTLAFIRHCSRVGGRAGLRTCGARSTNNSGALFSGIGLS